MIEIDWKFVSKESPTVEIKHGKKYSSVSMPECLVSNGKEVWVEYFDPSEGFDSEIIKYIELTEIKA